MFASSIEKSLISTLLYQIFSKGIGYGKYLLFAFLFGTSMQMDACNMALTILDVSMFVLGHVFSVVGIPMLVKSRKKSFTAFKKLSGSIFVFSLVLATIIIVFQYIFFYDLVSILAPGFDDKKSALSYEIFKYFLPMNIVYLPYFALISFFRSLNLFSISNFLDFLIAIFSITYLVIFLSSDIAIIPLSLSVAYVFTIFFALYFAIKIKIIGFTGSIFTPYMKNMYKNIAKLSLWFLVLQLYRVVDKGFASLLDNGAISALVYASMLISGMSFVFDFAYVYITKFSEKEDKAAVFTLAIKLYIFLTLPVVVYLLFYSKEFISIIYGGGKFDKNSIEITSSIIVILSPLLFLSLVNGLFQSLYQSLEKYAYVICLSLIGVLINFVLNYLWISKYGIVGIALATLVSTGVIIALNLLIIHYKENLHLSYKNILFEFMKYLLAAGASFVTIRMLSLPFFVSSVLFFVFNYVILVLLRNEFIIRIYSMIRKR
ncbi:lipid II flippase MurJ [Campylobacter concisus]|uniref:lipid II flippase MurJ n=1 Tax=Campylobacter concisus TaxID=199 RepID=UPI000CD9CD3E|nr:lipid II flippase MurJ [Campylobacter concisus]